MKFTKGSVFSTTIYEYNSASDAKERYDVRVNEVKQEGGYKEIQFNHSGSECYGTIEDFQIKERITRDVLTLITMCCLVLFPIFLTLMQSII